MRRIDEIIVHCSATRANWMEGESVEAKRDEIRRWHVEDRGWRDIGYHFVIDRDGTVATGRPVSEQGAHVKGHNADTIGICLLGGHGGNEKDQFDDHFTAEQDAALRDLIDQISAQYAIKRVSGHNEYAAKACPCFMVTPWFDRETKAPRKTPAQSTTIQATVAAGASGAVGVFTALSKLDPVAQYIVLGCAAVGLLALGWIFSERLRKWRAGDR